MVRKPALYECIQARCPTSDLNSWTCLWYSAARASAMTYVFTLIDAVQRHMPLMCNPLNVMAGS